MNIPITQSREWQKLQEDLGDKSFFESTDNYQYLAIKKSTPVGNYLYLPYGPVASDKPSLKSALKSLEELGKKEHALFIRIEPQLLEFEKIKPNNAKKSKDLSPKETWQLDLTGNEDELKAKLPSRLLRYYKNHESKGVSIETSKNPSDIHYLLDLQKALASKKGISTFSEKYLETELKQDFATLYIVKYTNEESKKTEVVAAGLVFDDKTTRYNLQGAQTDTGRSLHATGILTIKLILDAYEKGLKVFDFWGIAPEGAQSNHPWAGFTAFKKTFAGYEVDYAGTYDIVLNPAKYKLYKLLRKARSLV
ncbi:peptidoglycan bridge formation glycyltransferase FemA/FemB family protein [Candidatus Saccharibacteria bacterium]|nr:peptidoglycan bridge formation glycyltransferase FemA/FemB family protein [Candidatus Saccharibacteria bacterium]